MENLAKTLTIVSGVLNLPAIFIWATVLLRSSKNPLGESMAAWLAANFSAVGILIMWLMLPSSALIFGLGGYVIEGKKISNIGVVVLSTILLFALAINSLVVG